MAYKCSKCGRTLKSKEALYEHLKKWHSRLKTATKKRLVRQYDRRGK